MSTAVFGAPGFKARSGRKVTPLENGHLIFANVNGYLGAESVMDAEEFFQAKRDAELGRWRWPENPDYVVYRNKDRAGEPTDGTVVVIHEPSGDRAWMDPDGAYSVDGGTAQSITDAGRAYFKAFPFTRKPWQNAQPGEVWSLTVDGSESAFYPSKSLDRAFTPVAPGTGRTAVAMDSFEIEAGRRIWPEDAA